MEPKGKGKGNPQDDAKGKGKGKGKADGKGKGKADTKGKGKGTWWACPEPRCAVIAGKVWMNPPSECQCGKCYTHRATTPVFKETQLEALRADIAAEATADAPVSKTKAKKLRNA